MRRALLPLLPFALLLAPGAVIAASAPAAEAVTSVTPATSLTAAAAERFAQLALDCVQREYPNKISHVLASDEDVRAPRALTPVFYGCFDWHSDVHAHWLLARLARLYPDTPLASAARTALARSLTDTGIAAEVAYLSGPGRASFERPYGLAWLLALGAELRAWDDDDARGWAATLAPLEQAAVERLVTWLPKLAYPIRTGEHNQTAFSFGLVWDWAAATGDDAVLSLLRDKAAQFYLADADCPVRYEPSGEDFLSPCLAEADFLRRVLAPAEFAAWLRDFLPGIPRSRQPWLAPGIVTDRSDPKLAHIDGLNLSRAWMLRGIAAGLPQGDARRAALLAAAEEHAAAALPAVTGEHYEGGHWLGTFAVYLLSAGGGESSGTP
ncbi:MAG TPA: DUF2891 domain-containing protein [Steroidobacteraceae bacterium]|nr:DUF2891 domain-containing protein [Steroidobacteraceae bacterium]HNS27540.1 DUF2891 domain-containing protein [Steroidobacteraceae bacterium]